MSEPTKEMIEKVTILGATTHVTSIIEGENGYVIVQGGASDDQPAITVIEGDDREGLVKLLTFLGEHFGESYQKYGTENINITFDRKGHKAE